MLVLGLDPGLATTGWALVRGDGQHLDPADYGVIRTDPAESLATRLVVLHDTLEQLIAHHAPDAAAIEELFFSTNVRTAMLVGQARGVALLTLAQAGLPTWEYTPMQVKQAVTGYGGADKRQIQQMVQMLLNLKSIPQPDDAADALAISICHHHSASLLGLLGT
ncbi:MAG: crossover junction endodeoxyribonuclease RuvC [Anaerolineae bacterium]|jgi:crossover junction endodeoxyribonuclease RuvC|nr:crossover junction endodeoxyribonuclease RuvC [Chloroflexota bacterium]